jgi:hypothetical protein
MITNQERINIIREKLNKTPLIKFEEPISVGVQTYRCLETRAIVDIHKEGKSIICTETVSIYNKTGEGTLNIREIKPGSVMYILWAILSEEERNEIMKEHFYKDTEWAYLYNATKENTVGVK